MEGKWWIILAAVVGIIALGILPSLLTERATVEERGTLLDAGHFVIEEGGVRLLEERYTLFSHPTEGYMLLSQGEITIGERSISLAQQTVYDLAFHPSLYNLAVEAEPTSQIISAQATPDGLSMEVRQGAVSQTERIPDTDNIALLDNNIIGHYVVLLMAIRAEALDREFTAAIPQRLLSLPAKIAGPNKADFRSGDTTYSGKRFDLQLGDIKIVLIEYAGHLAGVIDQTQGTVAYDLARFPDGIELPEEERSEVEGVMEEEIAFASDRLAIAGTLTLPAEGTPPFAAALFIGGSGSVDRDGNAPGLLTDSYLQLAHALAKAGIASLRYDKRGVGKSEGDLASASRSDLLNDVRAALAALRAQPEIDPDRIFLIGHSEGAYLAPIIASEDDTIRGIVLLAGAARSLDEITRWQIETSLRMQGAPEERIAAALAQEDQYIEFVKTSSGEWSDYTFEELHDAIPWLTEQAAAQLTGSSLSLTWLREHYLADPTELLRKIRVPVLIVNGEKDLQVPAEEADRIREVIEEAGNRDVTVYILSDFNHLLRHHPEEASLNYRHLNEPVDPRLIDILTGWAVERFANR